MCTCARGVQTECDIAKILLYHQLCLVCMVGRSLADIYDLGTLFTEAQGREAMDRPTKLYIVW